MHWRLIFKEFMTNIQHISGVDNILDDVLSRLLYKTINRYAPITSRDICLYIFFVTISYQLIYNINPLEPALVQQKNKYTQETEIVNLSHKFRIGYPVTPIKYSMILRKYALIRRYMCH